MFCQANLFDTISFFVSFILKIYTKTYLEQSKVNQIYHFGQFSSLYKTRKGTTNISSDMFWQVYFNAMDKICQLFWIHLFALLIFLVFDQFLLMRSCFEKWESLKLAFFCCISYKFQIKQQSTQEWRTIPKTMKLLINKTIFLKWNPFENVKLIAYH